MIRVTYRAENDQETMQGVNPPPIKLVAKDHEADTVTVEDDHLWLHSSNNEVVAGYAPGWVLWEKVG